MHFHLPVSPVAACLSLAVTAALPAQRLPEIEPNNVVGQAQTVLPATHIEASLVAGEEDWYTFTLTGTQEVHLQTTGGYGVPALDTVVFLYDATGTTRLAWNDNGKVVGATFVLSDCGVTLPAGTYTCKVVGKTVATTGAYGFDFIAVPAAVIATVEGAEPNNSPASGGTPTVFTAGDTVTGNISTAGAAAVRDEDWWQFSVTTRAIVSVMVGDYGGVTQCDAHGLQEYVETVPGVWVAAPTALLGTGGHRAGPLVVRGACVPGTNYAVNVFSGAVSGTAPFNYTKVGNYGLRTQRIDMPGTLTVPESAEPNNTPGTAGFLSLGDYATGSTTNGDQDWFGFFVAAGPLTLGFMTDGDPVSATPIGDTTVRLYDSGGNLLSAASPSNATNGATNGLTGNLHGRLVINVTSPGLYYVSVEGTATGTGTGDYVLYTGSAAPMIFGSSNTFGPVSNGCPGSNALTPTLDAAAGEVPQLGSLGVTRLTNALPGTIALGVYGFSNTTAFGGAVPLPLDLAIIGMPSCFGRVDPVINTTVFADGSGTAFFDVAWLLAYSTLGQQIYMQAICFDPTLNALGFSVSNEALHVLGDRGY